MRNTSKFLHKSILHIAFFLSAFSPLCVTAEINTVRQVTVLPVAQISAQQAARILSQAFSNCHFTADQGSNAIVATSTAAQVEQIRTALAGIDARNPLTPTMTVLTLQHISSINIFNIMHPLFPQARLMKASKSTIIVRASPTDTQQIQSIVSALDVAPPAPSVTPSQTDVVRVDFADARHIAREVAGTYRQLRINVNGANILLTGPVEVIGSAKTLISTLDHPDAATRYTAIYRPRFMSVLSIQSLLSPTFPKVTFSANNAENALVAVATTSEQRRISEAISQLDSQTTSAGVGNVPEGSNASNLDVYTLAAAIPGTNGSNSTTAADLAGTVLQVLASRFPDLKVTVVPGSSRLILSGSSYSTQVARELLKRLDIVPALVVLDVRIFEVDETSAKDLGLSLPNPVISSTFSESSPPANADGTPSRVIRLQPIQRSLISLSAQLNFLVQNGKAKVLADPHITTLSGHTATIRAGDTISVQTTAGGGAGTVATTQLQTFQTGVSLDITPIVNANNFITVTLHPTVNSEIGILNGIPQIATRDTETTVALGPDETLAIGGLIQESMSSTENRFPILGDLPLLGSIFRETQKNYSRNELVVTVTPRIVHGVPLNTQSGNVIPLDDSATSNMAPSVPLVDATAAPMPLPSVALSAAPSLNTYTYGAIPQNNFAQPQDAVHIFYATMSPSVIKSNQSTTISMITTTNTTSVKIKCGSFEKAFTSNGPGQWSLQINGADLPTDASNQSQRSFTIIAEHNENSLTSIPMMLNVLQ